MAQPALTVGSLFSGIGAFDLGLERAGLKIAFQVEIDPLCQESLAQHWPDIPRFGDIHEFGLDTYICYLYEHLSPDRREVIDLAARRKDYDDAVRMYDAGLSLQAIAGFYGIGRNAMWMILKRRGCQFRSNLRFGTENHFYRGGQTASDYAQNLTEEAIEKGVITQKPCENCGHAGTMKDGRSDVQAHHPDYNKPLDVIWLCQKCHHEWHKHHKAIQRREEVMPSEVSAISAVDVLAGGFP